MKSKIIYKSKEIINQKINVIISQLELLNESLFNETKSSAGDKYETSRAMLHNEKEKYMIQLNRLKKNLADFHKISLSTNGIVEFGSLVFTNKGNFFVAPGSGKIVHEKETFFTITLNSPIGKLLKDKRIGETFSFRELIYKIRNIL